MVEQRIEKKNSKISIEDGMGNKFFVHGKIGGFTIKKASRKKTSAVVVGLDNSWVDKKVLCILVDSS